MSGNEKHSVNLNVDMNNIEGNFAIFVDNRMVQRQHLELSTGKHTLRVESDSHKTYEETITVTEDMFHTVELEPIKYRLQVDIQTDGRYGGHHEYTMFVDGQMTRMFPIDVAEGEHTIKIKSDKYETVTETVYVDSDTHYSIELELDVPSGEIRDPTQTEVAAKVDEDIARELFRRSSLSVERVDDNHIKLIDDRIEFGIIDKTDNGYFVQMEYEEETKADDYRLNDSDETEHLLAEFDTAKETIVEIEDKLPSRGLFGLF